MADGFASGHFRLGRLNEAAGVCGGRGIYGYSNAVHSSGDQTGKFGLPVAAKMIVRRCLRETVFSERVREVDAVLCFDGMARRHSRLNQCSVNVCTGRDSSPQPA
jgi:hypothetical protein